MQVRGTLTIIKNTSRDIRVVAVFPVGMPKAEMDQAHKQLAAFVRGDQRYLLADRWFEVECVGFEPKRGWLKRLIGWY